MTRTWRDYNLFLLGSVFILTCFSVAIIYSIGLSSTLSRSFFSRHLIFLVISGVAMMLMTLLDYHALQAWSRPLYIGAVLVLVGVLVNGQIRGGARGWFDLGFVTVQPAEVSKLPVIIALAAFWARYEQARGSWKVLFGSLILLGIPVGLIFIQPDTGTAFVYLVIWCAMAWSAGLRIWQLLMLVLAALPAAYYAWTHVLNPYAKERLLIFLDPNLDPTGSDAAWDVVHALNAVGTGGMTGRGWMHGLITHGGYISAIYTDFVFAAISEEFGFIGTAAMLAFQCILLWQALTIASTSRDLFGRLIAVGIMGMFFCHLLVHVGMNMQIMPVTGLPLPFISYGGSFTLTTFAAIGLLESIAIRRRKMGFS